MPATTLPSTGLSPQSDHGLAHLPVSVFASVMGTGGSALAWHRAAEVWDLPMWPSHLFVAVATVLFATVVTAYLTKVVRWPHTVLAELRHPMRISFVPTITIALLVLGTALQDLARPVAVGLWWAGAVGQLVATVWAMSAWTVREDIGVEHITPAWFIPVVGNIVTPLGAPRIGSVELAWFTFGVGILFWIALLPLVLYRVVLHSTPFAPRLLPTYAIFVAPPAMGLLSWQSLTGDLEAPLARVLYATTIIFVLLVAAQWPALRRVPFGLPYWSYTFPFASAASAGLAVADGLPGIGYEVAAVLLLLASTLLTVGVLVGTLVLLVRGRLLLPEG